jgi:hypothetical protein
MKAKPSSKGRKAKPAALDALRRAAKNAIELGRLTGTPAYVLENGRIIDAARRSRDARKKRPHVTRKKP